MKGISLKSAREVVGMVITATGVALVPVGWYSSRSLWFVAGVLIVVGSIMLFTTRVLDAEKKFETMPVAYVPPTKAAVPGDIHNYSGWQDAGQSLGGEGGGDGD